MTNEERIKNMSDEELAHFLSGITGEIGYDLNGVDDFHDFVNHQICDDQDIYPLDGKECQLNHGIDDSCPYDPWQRIQYWLHMPAKENN